MRRLLIAVAAGVVGALLGAGAWLALLFAVISLFLHGGHEGGSAAGGAVIAVAFAPVAAILGAIICAVYFDVRGDKLEQEEKLERE